VAILGEASDKALWIGPAEEIRQLHQGILSAARNSLTTAIRIGEILSQVKEALKHGEWLPWLAEHAPFHENTARNYIRVFEKRYELKSTNVVDLSAAYAALSNGNGDSHRPQQLHEPNFHSQAVRLRQNLVGLFNHHLQRRPLRSWQTEEIYDLLCSLKSVTEICQQLELELGTRNDLPASYRSANGN